MKDFISVVFHFKSGWKKANTPMQDYFMQEFLVPQNK